MDHPYGLLIYRIATQEVDAEPGLPCYHGGRYPGTNEVVVTALGIERSTKALASL